MATVIPDGMDRLSSDRGDFRTIEAYVDYMREQINFAFAQAERARREAEARIASLEEQIKNINGGT